MWEDSAKPFAHLAEITKTATLKVVTLSTFLLCCFFFFFFGAISFNRISKLAALHLTSDSHRLGG